MKVQSVLFDRSKFTKTKSINKLIKRGFKYNKIDITDKYFRFRQYNPKKNEKLKTIKAGNGIKYIYSI